MTTRERTKQNKLTSIERLKYFQKEICVVLGHDFICSVRREEERLVFISLSLLLPSPLPLSSQASLSVLLMGFPVFLPPLFPVLSLSPPFSSLARSLSLSACLSPSEGRLGPAAHRAAGGKLWQSSCLWKRKTTLSHFLLFCLKLATGVAYLCRTEILEVGRQACFYNHFLSHHFLQVD